MAATKVKTTSSSELKHTLDAEKREVFGRKVKGLRRNGVLPANVYGRSMQSLSVQLPTGVFKKIFEEVGETGLVGLKVGNDVYPVLVHNLQVDPVTEEPLHVDFLQVNLKEKVTVTIPLEFVGESSAEVAGEGIVVHQLNEVEVEALPTDLPEKIVVDISGLSGVDEFIKVVDLNVDRSKVEIRSDLEQVVAIVAPPAKAEEIAPPPEVPAEEGAAPAEGEAPAEVATTTDTETEKEKKREG
ncbi:MAG: 50S ribosomal protein L25 [Candidatus Blackburnbacteria bacterium]|nr:50S ribosomal protein L25 [Candidatus Blackburnbacteria bacterium]